MRTPVEFITINKILLIDDDATANYLSKELLESLNVAKEIEVAENGIRALKLLQQSEPAEVIFLDVKMPGIDGFDFLEKLKDLMVDKKIKVFMLTSSVRPEDKLRAFTYRAVVDYFEKPLTPEMVRTALTTYLN
jgi:CheY-like chemotaxis protein